MKNIHEVSRAQLVRDIESIGLKYAGGNIEKGFMHFNHKTREIRIRIDPAHIKGKNKFEQPHIHIYDKNGNSLNANLKIVNRKYNEAHIAIQEISNILMENKI